MKLSIYEELPKVKEKEIKEIFLKLQKDNTYAAVRLIAVGKSGVPYPSGQLISFYEDGSIYYHKSINKDLGFSLDDRGRLK
jgi:hypothetical protein